MRTPVVTVVGRKVEVVLGLGPGTVIVTMDVDTDTDTVVDTDTDTVVDTMITGSGIVGVGAMWIVNKSE